MKASIAAILLALRTTTVALMAPAKPTIPKLRIELFFRNADELRERVRLLSSNGVQSFNLVNKSNKDDLQRWANVIRRELPESDVCCHYSLKYNKSRKKDGAFLQLKDFLKSSADAGETSAHGTNEVLLVTGSGPKGKLDAVSALERLKRESDASSSSTSASKEKAPIVAVAFNPFFPSERDAEVEKRRLSQKIATGRVGKIYLQFGTNLERLRSSLDWLNGEVQKEKKNIAICGSIFLPTKKLIAQQKYRPWNGVFLSEDFLNSEEGAQKIVLSMMRLYDEYGCEILIEAPGVRNEKDMELVHQLLADRDSIGDESVNGDGPQIASRVNGRSVEGTINGLVPSPGVTKEALQKPAIVLFGTHDVRVHDNVALQCGSFHSCVIPVFIWSRREQGKWGATGALEVVLKDALMSLRGTFGRHGLKLICRAADDSAEELCHLCRESNASAVYLNKEHTPESRLREQRQRNVLMKSNGIQLIECQSSLLYDPMDVSLAPGFHGGHWGTLMPFLKGCKKQLGEPRRPMQRHETLALLKQIKSPVSWPQSSSIESLGLANIKGKRKWDVPIKERFPMSEDEAFSNLNKFFIKGFHRYERERSRADIEWSTSKLSSHLRIGTLSPNELYYKVEESKLDYEEKKTFSRRLYWRDLAYFHLLNFPRMREYSIRVHYDDTEWVTGLEEERRFEAWKWGKTGFPLVDAGMRELYATGWMTQSVRMVVASFLTEYLRVNWVKGCEWFHYTLVDADSAINAMMWQNAGRCGIDQWNFVMSPVAASQDGTGAYTKRWVPELSKLSKPLLHKPWDAPEAVLKEAGIVLGETYPHRIITDLVAEREISDKNVLAMRRKHQQFNNERGYDLVKVGGKETVVFTKKQFRIDREGHVIKAAGSGISGGKGKGNKRGGGHGKRKRARGV